ncbi:PP2C family protein-serine/threonine phosphatase [Actinacidiphila bryophytorum]|uniref:PP2C family protein-serine/threonine phosphatase n=1 Tax=Actinacidiphila bryophytorum TaxID=1436133 RepID=UPI00396AB11D
MHEHRGWRRAEVESTPELLGLMGRLVDQTGERIRLQRARVELALALQRNMLPRELPRPPGLKLAARYLPSQDGLDVGGDWYDAFPMAGGTVAISVGDVQGHDVEAAAAMGQVRIGLRALAGTTTDPGDLLRYANDLLLSTGGGLFATCCFLRFDPATGDLDLARAGHVPMVWAVAGGEHGVADDSCGPPLGVLPGTRYPVTHRTVRAAGSLVLLTDGVVEGPACPIGTGLAEVARLVTAGCDGDPDELASSVIRVSDLTGHTDDAAVLVAHYDGHRSS